MTRKIKKTPIHPMFVPTAIRVSTRVHSSEIATKVFPRARRGPSGAAVDRWLKLVSASHAGLEQELAETREERDRLLSSMRRARREPVSAEIRSALVQARLPRRGGGYERRNVDELLHAAATEMARLENTIALLDGELASAVQPPGVPPEIASTLAYLQAEITALREDQPHLRLREVPLPSSG